MPYYQAWLTGYGIHPHTVIKKIYIIEDFDVIACSFNRCIQHFPLLFIQSEVFAPAVECSLSAATLHHRDAFMSAMKYLKALLACPYNKEVGLYSLCLLEME